MKNCPVCGSDMKNEDHPCIFCDNEGCLLCRDNNGMITITSCTKKGCSWYDDEDEDGEEINMYENEKKELVEVFGLNESLAEDLLASRNAQEIETVMVFLRRYGQFIRV